MLLQLKSDLQSIFPQSQWDKIDTLVPLFIQTERTHLRKYLGTDLLAQLNDLYTDYTDGTTGIQIAIVSTPSGETEETSSAVLDVLSACQRYIGYLTFANNTRIFSSSFNRGGGVNRAYSDSYDTLEEKDFAALSKELFMQSQDALEDLLVLLEEDAKSDTPVFLTNWQKNERYFYHHSGLLFPTALSLNPYYDICERREKYQSLVPTIESCQRRYLLPNIGKSLYEAFLTLTNSAFSSQQSSPLSSEVSSVLEASLPDLLHSLAYYLRADLTTQKGMQQEQQQYLLRAAQHLNLAMRTICEAPDTMQTYILSTPLDKVYADLNSGITLTDQLAKEAAEATGEDEPCIQKHSHTLPEDSFILDLT